MTFHDNGPHLATVSFFPVAAGWEAQADIAVDGRRLVIANLTIHPEGGFEQPPTAALDSSVLRAIRTGEIVNRVYRELLAQPGLAERWEAFLGERVPDSRHDAEARATAALNAGVTPRGRRGLPEKHYRKIACLYLDLQAAGWGRGILSEIARREGVPRGRARDYVHGATTRKFLSPGTPGVAGRFPGSALTDYTPKRVAGPPTPKKKTNRKA